MPCESKPAAMASKPAVAAGRHVGSSAKDTVDGNAGRQVHAGRLRRHKLVSLYEFIVPLVQAGSRMTSPRCFSKLCVRLRHCSATHLCLSNPPTIAKPAFSTYHQPAPPPKLN